jgi:hypothetical protein
MRPSKRIFLSTIPGVKTKDAAMIWVVATVLWAGSVILGRSRE